MLEILHELEVKTIVGMNTMEPVYETNVVAHRASVFHSQQEKCHQYWPAERSARYQYFVVDPMAEYNMPQYILREFKVTDARVSGHRFIEQSWKIKSDTVELLL